MPFILSVNRLAALPSVLRPRDQQVPTYMSSQNLQNDCGDGSGSVVVTLAIVVPGMPLSWSRCPRRPFSRHPPTITAHQGTADPNFCYVDHSLFIKLRLIDQLRRRCRRMIARGRRVVSCKPFSRRTFSTALLHLPPSKVTIGTNPRLQNWWKSLELFACVLPQLPSAPSLGFLLQLIRTN
jgi:hypothetical protein